MAIGKPALALRTSGSVLAKFLEELEEVRILVGPDQRAFKVNRKLLSTTSTFFAEKIEAHSRRETRPGTRSLWLPAESPAMFELFMLWLHNKHDFGRQMETAIATASTAPEAVSQRLQWSLIRVHIFASQLDLHHLQDAAMDALQDLYLKCNWDVAPRLIRFLYGLCDPLHAVRLRRWAIAMIAFSIAGGGSVSGKTGVLTGPARWQDLFSRYPEFMADYDVHLKKMALSRLDLRFKNPQLRIQANKLRNDERQFGFRQCSFHSHRASVGERQCPHTVVPVVKPLPPPRPQRPECFDRLHRPLSVTFEVWEEPSPTVQNAFPQDVPKPLRRMKSTRI